MVSTTKGDVIELGGREFTRVRNGLDEAQVASFINELINQRDTHAQAHEHASSLIKLAERIVIEADKLAQEIKTKAMDQAKAEADAIIAEAERQGQRIGEEKCTEVVAIANEEAAAIKTEAERQAKKLLKNERGRIQHDLSDFVQRLCGQLLSQLETLKGQVVALQAELGHRLSEPEEDTGAMTSPLNEISEELSELFSAIDETNAGEPDWELEILPPIDIMKIMSVVAYLDQLPEIEKTEVIPRALDRPSILIYLRESIELMEKLRIFPGVAQITEDTAAIATDNAKTRKVQIVLPGVTVPQEGT